MNAQLAASLFLLSLFPRGCSAPQPAKPAPLKYIATGKSPEVLAVYEAWFGHPSHIPPSAVGYSSHDPAVLARQMDEARARGISAFVVDWYGDREPFIDQSYAMMQSIAGKKKFQIAMMYDETDHADDATDEAIADFTMFHDTYLSDKAKGHKAYLTYQGRPVIFIFPKGGHTDWSKVRAIVSQWKNPPWLIDENLPDSGDSMLDGFYAWINPGPKGWAADGSNWGEEYLAHFYETMRDKYPDKIVVGGAWALFNDVRASWSLNRHIDARCGQTYQDTFNFWKRYFPADRPIPFILVETWNDYEEGSAVEPGIPTCTNGQPNPPAAGPADKAAK
jgi:hypothetical protein